jgi:ribose transport system ATP-binding protein
MGAGRTELANVLFGVEQRDAGELAMNGCVMSHVSPSVCISQNAAFITEDRRSEGLLMSKPVDDNLSLVKMADLTNRLGVVNVAERASNNRDAIKDLQIKVADPEKQLVSSLSGGNQQKVVFGKWVMKDPKIFILDEPTRGVDVGAKFEIYSIILNLAKRGSAVLFISSELQELMGTCDRILVMKEGSITGDVSKAEFDQERILEMALPGFTLT